MDNNRAAFTDGSAVHGERAAEGAAAAIDIEAKLIVFWYELFDESRYGLHAPIVAEV